jgi:Spy/CpxP family protein refolding chaperone
MKTLFVSMLSVILLTFCLVGVNSAQQKGPEKLNEGGRGMRGMMQHRNEMIKKLNLTDEQKDKIKDLRTTFQKNMVDLRSDLEKSRIDLKVMRSKDNLNRDDVIAAVDKMNKSRDAISLAVANHLFDIYKVLTPEQQKILKENTHGMGMPRWGNRGRIGGRNHMGFEDGADF